MESGTPTPDTLVEVDYGTRRPFRFTEQKRQAVDLVAIGMPKAQIARALGVHRNTVNGWCATPAFVAAVQERLAERISTTRLRRMAETSAHGDHLHRIALDLLEAARAAPADPAVLAAAKIWVAAYG